MVGGLIVSQALTLFTTPVVYLYLDKLAHFVQRGRPVDVEQKEAEEVDETWPREVASR
jgi:hypothetical protein